MNDLHFNGTHFIGVGREGTRAVATSVVSFDSDAIQSDSTLGDLNAIAEGDGLLVAVGGGEQYSISTSADGGYTWISQVWNETTHSRLSTVAFNNGIWITQGASNHDAEMYRSTDGYTWEAMTAIPYRYHPLGTHNGWFFSTFDGDILRSQDGETREVIHTLPTDVSVIDMAAESWSAP